jgi:hypothetical protein
MVNHLRARRYLFPFQALGALKLAALFHVVAQSLRSLRRRLDVEGVPCRRFLVGGFFQHDPLHALRIAGGRL